MNSIVNAPGQALKLSIGSESPEIVASFALPADNAPLKQMMSSCLDKSLADAQATQAITVAACPPKQGKILTDVSLKYVDTGKDVPGDMDDMDNGGTWKLSAGTKSHPARRAVMTCSYRDAGQADGSPITDKATVPVPINARSCDFTVHENELRNDASCISAAPKSSAANKSPSITGAPSFGGSPVSQQASKAAGSASTPDLPAGPTAPINRLNVRGISVRMGRGQILAAAKAANMNVLSNVPQQIKLVDPTASGKPVGGASSLGGSGLVLLINMKDDRAITIYINEQGDMNGHVFEDIQRKWGAPKGKDDVGPYWGDLNGVYADYDGNMYGFLGMHVTIQDKAAFPAPPKRQSVPM